jgi:ketosteroid isomerase-like protein
VFDTRAQDETAIRGANAAVGEASNALDAGTVASFYTDAVTLMPPNAPIVTGRENVKAFLAVMLTPADFSLSPERSPLDQSLVI